MLGGFSTVHKGVFRGSDVVVKKIFNPVITQDLIADLSNEITMMSEVKHRNIALVMAMASTPPNLCIVIEYMPNGSLFDVLHTKKYLIILYIFN